MATESSPSIASSPLHVLRTAKSTLGVLPPILGLAQSLSLILLALVLWRLYLGGQYAPWLLLPLLLSAFVPYFIGVYVCGHPDASTSVRAILFFAILFRVILWGTPPVLSDDIYRYVWEGRVQNHGFNPYALAPDAEELSPLQDDLYKRVNHPWISAIYPPFAQMMFRALAWLPYPLAWLKLFFGAVDVLNVWLLICILRARDMPHQLALIYAWNPLPIVEFAGSGHFLSVGICFFLGAYHAVQRDRQIVAAVAAGLAIGTNFLILAPLLHVYNALKKQWLPVVAIVVALLYVPFIDAGRHLFDGLMHYAAMWKFNDSIFGLLVAFFDSGHRPLVAEDVHLAFKWPKIIAGLVLAFMGLNFIFRNREWLRSGYLMTGALLLLSPTVHPWYVTLILPFLCFYRNFGWLAFTALVTVAYSAVVIYQLTGEWISVTMFPSGEGLEAMWIGWLEYGTFYVLLVWSVLRKSESQAG